MTVAHGPVVLPLLSSRDRPAHGRCTRAPSSPLSPSTDTRVVSVVLRVRVPRSTHNWLVMVSTLRSTLHDQPGPRGTFAGSVASDGALCPSQARGNAHIPRVGVAAAGLDAARPLATPAAQRHVRVHGPGASEIRRLGKAASAGLQKAATSVFGSKATRSRVEFSKSRGSPPQKSRWSPKRLRSLSFSHGSSRPRACARGTCCRRGVCPVGGSGGGSRRAEGSCVQSDQRRGASDLSSAPEPDRDRRHSAGAP